ARAGKPYADYLAATSAMPFAAILAGRQRFVWREFPLGAFATGLAVAVALRAVHGSIFANGGVWVIATVIGGAGIFAWQSARRARVGRRGLLGRRRRPPDGGRGPRGPLHPRRLARNGRERRRLDRPRRGGALAWRLSLLRLHAGRRWRRRRGRGTMTSPGPASLIYDGACAFCRRRVERLHRCDRLGSGLFTPARPGSQ